MLQAQTDYFSIDTSENTYLQFFQSCYSDTYPPTGLANTVSQIYN